MRWHCSVFVLAIVALTLGASTARAEMSGPYPGNSGNDTGGIIPYAPRLEGRYRQMARDYCASWGRLSQMTSVRRRYGGYIGLVCIDKPWIIH